MGKVIELDPRQKRYSGQKQYGQKYSQKYQDDLRKKQEENLLEELERIRQENLKKASEENPFASEVLWEDAKKRIIELSKDLKSIPESKRSEYLKRLRDFAEEQLSKSAEAFTDHVLNQTKPQGLDEDEDERKRIAKVVEADIKRNIGGFVKVYKESFEELKNELERSSNFQIPNEVLPIAIVLAIARAIGSAVEILASSGNFATGLSALGLDKYYQAKLSKAISIAEEKTGLRMDEETKEQLFRMVGEGTTDRKLINAVASKMGTDFGLVFAKAWDELKPRDLFDFMFKKIGDRLVSKQEQEKAQSGEQPRAKQEEGQKSEAKQEKAQAEKQEEEQKAESKQEEGQKAEAKEVQKQAEQRQQEEEAQKNQAATPPPEEVPGNQFMPSAPSPFPKTFF